MKPINECSASYSALNNCATFQYNSSVLTDDFDRGAIFGKRYEQAWFRIDRAAGLDPRNYKQE